MNPEIRSIPRAPLTVGAGRFNVRPMSNLHLQGSGALRREAS
jgi:hypothetical protein